MCSSVTHVQLDSSTDETGGLSYTVGLAAAPPTLNFAPPTLCFAIPTFGRSGGFLVLKRWFSPQSCKTVTFVDISAFSFLFL